MTDTFKLTATIAFFSKFLKEKRFFEVYPQIKSELEGYIGLAEKSSSYIDQPENCFRFSVNTGFDDDYYHIIWSVEECLNFIRKANIPQQHISLNAENIFSDRDLLDMHTLEIYKAISSNGNPILLAWYEPLKKWIVVDGNHRFHAAKSRGDKSINAVKLSPVAHVPLMMTERSKLLYLIHHNLAILLNYCSRPLALNIRASKNFDGFSYYPLIHHNVEFSLINRLRLMTAKLRS